MDWQYDCFISYAHEDNRDSGFAQRLAGWLELAGLKVWRDSAALAGGRTVEDAIRAGLAASRCLVCLVTESWYTRPFTRWELQLFLEDGASKRAAIPVFLAARDIFRLGPHLSAQKGITGLGEPAAKPAAFWELYCAIAGRDLGPEREWTTRGNELLHALPAGFGGLEIAGLPEGAESSRVRIIAAPFGRDDRGTPWDGGRLHLPPGHVKVELVTSELYDLRTAHVVAGGIAKVQLEPSGVIWYDSESRWRTGSGDAAAIHASITYVSEAQVLAARVAYIANRVSGHSVLSVPWVYFKDKGDGALEGFVSVNTLLYHEDDRAAAEALQQHLRRAAPPIRVAMQPNSLTLLAPLPGRMQTWPHASPNRITIFLVEE